MAQRLRYALLQNPAITEYPRCGRCGMLVALKDWSKREGCCVGCEHDADPMMWNDTEDDFLPPEN